MTKHTPCIIISILVYVINILMVNYNYYSLYLGILIAIFVGLWWLAMFFSYWNKKRESELTLTTTNAILKRHRLESTDEFKENNHK